MPTVLVMPAGVGVCVPSMVVQTSVAGGIPPGVPDETVVLHGVAGCGEFTVQCKAGHPK